MEGNRIASWWIRWEDLDWSDPSSLDRIKARAEGLAKADVTAAMIFGTHFRWDWLPFFPLVHDYLAEVAEALHGYGIKLYDHHSVNLVHRYSTREEMRHVMRDSSVHLPLSPTWEAAASWEYKGKRLNDWRMIDVESGKPAFLPQYTAECFCQGNPEYKEAYFDYIRQLVADTGIDGLSADDGMHYMHFRTCGCRYCRAALRERSGIDLPPADDRSFWFNWDNPAWNDWIDLRFEATGEFYRDLRKQLPEDFFLTACGSTSASARTLGMASDARQFLRGCNVVNLEMCGNMPPYKHDPKTANHPIPTRVVNTLHHQAAGRERGVRALNTCFAHTTVTANIGWAVSKLVGADAWLGTLKPRLGLPESILRTLPEEKDFVGQAFGFEKAHPELFQGELAGQLGVYFSYETRNHTFFGSFEKGYAKDYSDTVALLFRSGISPHTLFAFPESAEEYPLVLLPSAARMTEEELAAARRYLDAGGRIVATGPTALPNCPNSWKLPNRADVPRDDMFHSVPDGIHLRAPAWELETELPPCADPDEWISPEAGLRYHPDRVSNGKITDALLALCREQMRRLPIEILEAKGYLCSTFLAEDRIILQLLAEDYDTDIDHKLDEMRFHRSRVNFINSVKPVGITGTIKLKTDRIPEIYTPITEGEAAAEVRNGVCTVTLPEDCSYVILQFKEV